MANSPVKSSTANLAAVNRSEALAEVHQVIGELAPKDETNEVVTENKKQQTEQTEKKQVIPPQKKNEPPPKEMRKVQQVIPKTKDKPSEIRVKAKPRPKAAKSRAQYEDEALAAIEVEDREEVEKILDEGLNRYPESAKLWSIRALYYLFSDDIPNNNELALKTAKYALSLDGDEPQCYAVLKAVYQEINNGQNIDEFYDIEDAVAAKHPEYYLVMGQFYETVNMSQDAVEYYMIFLNIEPTHRDTIKARERVAELTIQQTIQAMPSEFRNKRPTYTEKDAEKLVWDALGKRDFDKMLAIYNASIYHYPRNDRLWAAYGVYYIFNEEPGEDALPLKYASIALALDTSNPLNYSGLAWIYQHKSFDNAAALFYYKKAESMGLKSFEMFYNMGFCADQLGDKNAAITYYTRFIQAAPKDERVPKVKSRIKALRGY